MIRFRHATRDDVPIILAMLVDDSLGATRETNDLDLYLGAFDQIGAEPNTDLIVGEQDGQIIATYQISYLSGLSLKAARRAQVESVRVAADLRGQGLGAMLMADAEARARAAGCSLIQLTTNSTRTDAHRFYERLGFTPSHIGFKRNLS